MGVPTRFGQGQKTVPIGVSEIGEPSGKVVSERLAHATPGFTMATYQHVLPGMQAEAARTFEALLVSSAWRAAGTALHD